MQNKKNNNENNSAILMIVLLSVAAILVFAFPSIYDYVNKFFMPQIEKIDTEEKEDKKEIDEDIIETIHYPRMRTSIYNANTYYSLDKFTISDMTNEDILITAFLDVYEGNMTSYNGTGACTNISKQFNKNYLELRINNIISKNINYTLDSFYVPEDSGSNYIGTWNYDSYNGKFTYQGLCNSRVTNIKYYNLEELIKLEYEEDDIVSYHYVGFAKVEGENYIIYKDANMTEVLKEGVFTSLENLNTEFANLKNKNMYKYTFKNTLCSYGDYCLYEGKWVNEF